MGLAGDDARPMRRGRPSYHRGAPVQHLASVLNIGPGVRLSTRRGHRQVHSVAGRDRRTGCWPSSRKAAMRAELMAVAPASVEVFDGEPRPFRWPSVGRRRVCARPTEFHGYTRRGWAMPEIARVLRDGGASAHMERARRARAWVRQMTEIIAGMATGCMGVNFDWQVHRTRWLLRLCGRLQVPYVQLLDRESFVDRVSSITTSRP